MGLATIYADSGKTYKTKQGTHMYSLEHNVYLNKYQSTVELRLTATHLIRPPSYCSQFLKVQTKCMPTHFL